MPVLLGQLSITAYISNNNCSPLSTKFITNEKGRTSLLAHLKEQIEKAERLDVFVGYFYMDGFVLIRDSLKDLKKIRILIGSVDDNIYEQIKEARKQQSSDKNRKRTLLDWLKSGDLEIKACHTHAHAKVYIITSCAKTKKGHVIIGSSNLTKAGLTTNLEYNVELKEHDDYKFTQQKFEELWKKSVSVGENNFEKRKHDSVVPSSSNSKQDPKQLLEVLESPGKQLKEWGLKKSVSVGENNFEKRKHDSVVPSSSNSKQDPKQLLEVLEKHGKQLKEWDLEIGRGPTSGAVGAFHINEEIRGELCKEDEKSKEVLKPLLGEGSGSIKCYWHKEPTKWLIYVGETDEGKLRNNYPAIYNHLQYKRGKSGKWWKHEYSQKTRIEEGVFDGHKIIAHRTLRTGGSRLPPFSYDEKGYWPHDNCFFIAIKPQSPSFFLKYLCGFFNSKIFREIAKKGKFGLLIVKDIKGIPVPPVTNKNLHLVKEIANLVDKILKAKRQNSSAKTEEDEEKIEEKICEIFKLLKI